MSQVLSDEQRAFETWARSVGKDGCDLEKSFDRDGFYYTWRTEQQMWEAWQAACAERDKRIAELERKSDQDDETIAWQAQKISQHIDHIAELEREIAAEREDVQRFRNHALNEKAARLELERQLEEARKQALEEAANAVDAMKAPDGYNIQEKSLYDVATMEAADAIRALKGAKE